jgi:flagellar hook-associated protein 3 FlgL
MRITQNTLFNSLRSHLRNANGLLNAQETVATQRSFNRLSENPIDAGRVLDLGRALSRSTQYLNNINRTSALADVQDQTMGQVHDLIQRSKELLLREANAVTSTGATRESARIEIAIITTQMVQVANSRFDGQYLFSGFASNTPAFADAGVQVAPSAIGARAAVTTQAVVDSTRTTYHDYQIQFTAPGVFDVVDTTNSVVIQSAQTYASGGSIRFDGLEIVLTDSPGAPTTGDVYTITTTPPGIYQGDGQSQEVEIQADTRIQQNVPGDRIFQGVGLTGGANIFDTLTQINSALDSNDRAAISSLLDDLDTARTQISNERANVGARTNLIASVKERQEDIQTSLRILRSNLEDIDLTDAITALNREQNTYEATLSAASRIVQPSLLDFLR